ncbi:MAG TPA: hypothetical protein P5181_03105 [Dermatophilaceae bacterium]|nr:hypothetical protein [Dermatophilaceae bacterium]
MVTKKAMRRPPPQVVHGLLAILATLALRSRSPLIQDAGSYFASSRSLAAVESLYGSGSLPLFRGVYSAVPFAPAAALERWWGVNPRVGILVTNALLIGALAGWLLPGLASDCGLRPRIWSRLLVTGLVVALLGPFASQSLMEIPAMVVLLLTARWAVAGGVLGDRRLLLGTGVFGVVVANVRPALGLAVGAAWAIALLSRTRIRYLATGAVLAALGQSVANLAAGYAPLPIPPQALVVAKLQSVSASVTVVYETPVVGNAIFYCDPAMAHFVEGDPQSSPMSAVVFGVRKLAASLLWTPELPFAPTWGVVGLGWAALTTLVTVSGLALLAARLGIGIGVRGRAAANARATWTARALWLLVAATVAVLVASTPERRFAMPLVLVSLIGLLGAGGSTRGTARRRQLIVLAGAAALTAVSVLVGLQGYEHPSPVPQPSSRVCAGLG